MQYAGLASGDASFNDVLNYGLGGFGLGINITEAHLKAHRGALVGKYSKDAVRQLKVIDKSLDGLGRTAKKLGIAGLVLSGGNAVYDYFHEGVTASQAFDLAVTGVLTFVTVTNPALLVGFGVYGLLDAAGAFDGIKEALGGDTVILKH